MQHTMLLFLLLFYFQSVAVFASPADSLSILATKYETAGEDELAAQAYLDLSEHYSESYSEAMDYSKAMEAIDKALELVPSDNIQLVGKAKSMKGYLTAYVSKDMKEAKIILEEAINMLSKYPKSEANSFVHLKYGLTLKGQGDYEASIPYLKKALEIYPSTDWKVQVQIHQAIGAAWKYLGNYDLAFERQRTVLSILKKQGDHFKISGEAYDEMGKIFHDMKDYDQAILNYKKGLGYAQEGKLRKLEAEILSNMGGIYNNQGKTKESREVLRRALKLHEILKDSSQIAYTLFVLNEEYVVAKEFDKALASAKKIIKYYKTQPDKYLMLCYVYLHSSSYASELGNPDLARTYAKKCLVLAKKMKSKELIKYSYETLHAIEKEQQNFEKALLYHENLFLTHDSIYTENAQQKMEEEKVKQQVEAETEAREKAELETASLTQRNRFFGAVAAGSLLLLLLGMYAYQQIRKSKQKIESQNFQLQQLNTTKDKFFGIIAHDIRSPIVALDGVGEQMEFYLKKNKPEKLERLASQVDSTAKRLSGLLDNLLNWALLQQGVIPYHPKSLNVHEVGEHIFEMFQNNADAKNITLHLQIDKSQKVYADESALNTILRNLVSNAIKFTPEGGMVSLSTETKGDKVFININDTGTGISTEHLSKLFSLEKQSEKGTSGERGTGLGLTLVKELAELNKGVIVVDSVLEKGSSFRVGLPVAA